MNTDCGRVETMLGIVGAAVGGECDSLLSEETSVSSRHWKELDLGKD